MPDEKRIDPAHSAIRATLRVIGPLTVIAGGLLTVVAIGSFFGAVASFPSVGFPRYFWCAFVGLPLLSAGIVMCKFAFMGAVARYSAAEVAPVGKDTINYLADGTEESVEQVAAAIGRGLTAGADEKAEPGLRCPECGHDNDAAARFCDNCRARLTKHKACPACDTENDADAQYCDNCGVEMKGPD